MMAGARGAEWLDGMQRASVLEVARALELAWSARGPGWVSPCPACGRDRRNASTAGEKRGALGLTRDGRGWRCFPCDAAGDALDLVAYRLGGRRWRELGEGAKAEVREWCGGFLGLDTSSPRAVAALEARQRASSQGPAELEPESRPAAYPPAAELAALWLHSVPVTDDAEASRYLAGRGLDAVRLAELDVVRALPAEAASASWCPEWAKPWPARGLRLVVPMLDAAGAVRSVLARTVRLELAEGERKSEAPRGFARVGLVMADPLGALLLEAGARPAWWTSSAPRLRVIVAEGEPDFWTWASASSDANEYAPAVFGIVGGSWTPEIAARVPDGAELVVRTHPDEPGAKYATAILGTVAERVAARRLAVRLAPWFAMRTNGGRPAVELVNERSSST